MKIGFSIEEKPIEGVIVSIEDVLITFKCIETEKDHLQFLQITQVM